MKEDKIQELLFNKNEALNKRLNRLYLFLFVFPFIYFLLDNSFATKIKISIISIEQKEIILLMFPVVYTVLILLILIISSRIVELKNVLDKKNKTLDKETKELLLPIFFLVELNKQIKLKGFLNYLDLFLVKLPLLISSLIFPFIFLINIIFINLKYQGNHQSISFWSGLIGIWGMIIILFHFISLIKLIKRLDS